MIVHPSWAPLLAALQQDKAPIKIFPEYIDFADVFSPDFAMELPKNSGINKYAIKLIEKQQPPYGPIYSLGLVELEILKAYIEIHLKTRFIRSFKSDAGTPILFD